MAILSGQGATQEKAIEILRSSERWELGEEFRTLYWRDPKLASELGWRWLRLPSIDAGRAETLASVLVDDERRELVDELRRIDPEHVHIAFAYEQAVGRTPRPDDRPFLLEHLEFSFGINGAAAGLVRLGDPRGLSPLLAELAVSNAHPWGPTVAMILPDEEVDRRVADLVLGLIRSRFDDAALREALPAVDPPRKGNVHAWLAHRLGLRAELLRLADANVRTALCLLSEYPGEETLAVLRQKRTQRAEVAVPALESLALLGDPALPEWIATHLDETETHDPWSAAALLGKLKALAAPLPAEPTPLSEEPAPDSRPLPVYADWSGRASGLLEGSSTELITGDEAWAPFWKKVRRPAPRIDFRSHAALAILYLDPDPATISSFYIRVGGLKRDEIRLLRLRSSFGFTAVDHAGTLWRVLVIPRSLLPLRIHVEDVVVD